MIADHPTDDEVPMLEPTPKAARRDLSALRIEREPAPPGRARAPWWLLVLVGLVALAAVGVTILPRLSVFAPQVELVQPILERPGLGAQPLLTASGYVVARTKASVSARLAGRLDEVRVEEGSFVQEGEVIARLDADDLEAEVESARALLVESEAAERRSRAERDLAQVEARRQGELLAAGVGTPNARDAAAATLNAREAAFAQSVAAVASSSARLERSRVEFEKSYVRAPFSGVVLRKEAEVGESVAPAVASGQLTRGAIVTMADLSELEVEADVAESNIARVIEGGASEIAVDAVPDRRYRGRVRQVMPTADRQKATVEVDVTILDADLRVKPEMGAKVTFLSGEPDAAALNAPPAVTAPADAIVPGSGGAFAWVVAGGRVTRARLELGERRGDRVVVAAGLSGGEMLVVSPPSRLDEGDVVRVTVR
jgi:RND family efflux transporter MFP subunit